MSFISKHDGVFRKLIDRFELYTLQREQVVIPSMIVPVTVIDDLLVSMEMKYKLVSITSATGFTIDTVPVGERWHVRSMRAKLSTGVYTIDALQCVVSPGTVTLIEESAQTVLHTGVLPQDVILDPGGVISVHCDGWTSIGNLHVWYNYIKEKIA